MDYSTSGCITNSRNLLKLMSIELVMHPIISSCRPLLLLPSIFPSIRVFSNQSVLCIRWPKYWSFRISISPSNEHSGLISFRIDWLDLLAVTTVLKHQFFGTQPSLWSNFHILAQLLENTQLTIQTFAGKVMSLPRSMRLLISW